MRRIERIWNSVQVFARKWRPEAGDRPPVLSVKKPWRRPTIGVALGGGFARGMAHIGVLKVLEEENIPIDLVAGTSVGAVIGAAYCSGVSAQELGEIAALIRMSDVARYTISRFGLCSNDRMTALLNRVFKARTFEELKIPLAVTATEFLTGDAVVFTSGELNDRVRASCAYPGIFTPVSVEGKLMVDGLLAHSVPASPLKRMGAERVISVHFGAHWVRPGGPRHVLDIIGQCFSIAQANMSCLWRADSDVCLEPDVAAYAYDDFARASELVQRGEEAARSALPLIRSWLQEPTPEIALPLKAETVASLPV